MSEKASQNDTVDLLREEISAISQFGPEALREDVLQKALAEIERLNAALEQIAHFRNQRTSRRDWVDPDVQMRAIALDALSDNSSDPDAKKERDYQDYSEVVLRVEITSDTDEKVETFRKQLCDAILAAPAALRADVMVTIHRDDGSLPVFETNRSPVEIAPEHALGGLMECAQKVPAQCTDCLATPDDTGRIQHKLGCSINYL